MNEQTLYTDEWITVTVDSNRFVLTWLNAVAGIAVVRVVFVRRPHNRARIGRALVGPDGGVWLESPALDIADPHAHTEALGAGLALVVEHVKGTVEP